MHQLYICEQITKARQKSNYQILRQSLHNWSPCVRAIAHATCTYKTTTQQYTYLVTQGNAVAIDVVATSTRPWPRPARQSRSGGEMMNGRRGNNRRALA